MTETLRDRLRRGDTLIGPLLTIGAPDVADVLSRAGFDYLWIDLEHSPMDAADAQVLVQAAGGRCPVLVRVPQADEAWIKKSLDTGADGVIIPQVRSAAAAREAVAWCHYPPLGRRGSGATRAAGYGATFAEYVATANDRIAVVLQVEHVDAVRDIEEILAIPGVTALFVGPYDLSGSLGVLGQVDHPAVQEAIETVRLACAAAGMPVGIYSHDAAGARAAIARGFTIIGLGTDAGYLLDAAARMLAEAWAETPKV